MFLNRLEVYASYLKFPELEHATRFFPAFKSTSLLELQLSKNKFPSPIKVHLVFGVS